MSSIRSSLDAMSSSDGNQGSSNSQNQIDGSNRFERAIRQIEETIISCSPDVYLPPPYLLLRLRDEEYKDRMEREIKETTLDPQIAAMEPRGSTEAGGVVSKLDVNQGSPGLPKRGASMRNGSSQATKISVDSKTGLQYYMTNNNSLAGIIRHQSITFSYSYFWSPKAVIPCQPPKILTVEYYRKFGEYEDKSLGEYLELLCSSARGLCPDPSCGKPMAGHIITYTHNQSRISVLLENTPQKYGPVPDDSAIYAWTTCQECGSRTDVVPISEATWHYSFAKYLEILCYDSRFAPANLCDHVGQKSLMKRYFRMGPRMVTIGYETIDLFEMRVPKTQVMPEHMLPARSTPPLPPPKPMPYPTPGSSPSFSLEEPVSQVAKAIAPQSPGRTNGVASLGASLLSGLSATANSVMSSRAGSPEPNPSHPVPALLLHDDGTNNPHYIGASAKPPLEEPFPFGLDVAAERILDATRLEILYFYGSLKDYLKALEAATGSEAVARNAGTPDQVRAQLALDEMGKTYRDEEEDLYQLVRNFAARPDRINNVRRVVAERAKAAASLIEAWQKTNAPQCRMQPAWFFPDYCNQKTLHIYPDSFVIVREDEPTSILAFTLSCKEYLDEVAKVERDRLASEINGSAEDASLSPQLNGTGGAEKGQGSGSPTLSSNAVPSTSTAAMAMAQVAAAADLARWEALDDFRVRVKLFTHEQNNANAPKQHLKLRFAEGKSIFVCTVYYAEQFENLRRRCNVTGPYIQSLLRCSAWNASGGKSRAVFFKTHDDQLVIKQLASNWTLVEKDALLKFAPLYFEYINNSDKNPTVLAKIFGFYTIKQKNLATGVTTELDVLVMDHLFANVKISRKFDLKGVPDRHSVSKRSSSNSSSNGSLDEAEVGWDGDWVDGRYRSLLMLHGHSKKIIQDSILNDTLFLASANVMDYSLLVGVNDEKKELIVGIVDFIGPYTWYKKIETRGKTTLRGKELCTVLPPDQYGERFRKAMDQYFLMVPDKWIKIPIQDNGSNNSTAESQKVIKKLPPVL
ncbi:1-phosphatidylinositol-3-phosphate 5-kinase [Phlyctochytrium planicorne]|nr:1-phosphatidylinositol-3-phosphate 5-kinase [Phlyctochytrium planicorne]